jgi:hypothetical protein
VVTAVVAVVAFVVGIGAGLGWAQPAIHIDASIVRIASRIFFARQMLPDPVDMSETMRRLSLTHKGNPECRTSQAKQISPVTLNRFPTVYGAAP